MTFFYRYDINNDKSITLQRILIDGIHLKNSENLYIRKEEKLGDFIQYNTDTYINIFHYTHWRTFAELQDIWLEVCCSGKGILQLKGHQVNRHTNVSYIPTLLASISVDSIGDRTTFRIDLDDSFDFFSLSWESNKNEPFHILNAAYMTHFLPSHRLIRLAIVATTYKRQRDIYALADVYKTACYRFSQLRDATHLFIINNDVSDQDIHVLQGKNITVSNNPQNLGGAGGFARGARDAVSDGSFSHILFMDDDALVHEESWLRSLSILSCLKKKFYDCPLAGTMFNRDAPSYCQTMLEALDKNFHRRLQCGETLLEAPAAVCTFLDTGHRTAVTETTVNLKKQSLFYPYAAWWYGIFPIKTFQRYGYPAPYFFRGDDQEFGLRIGRAPLFLNGICVWHPPFSRKRSALRQYLGIRNFLLTTAMHHNRWKIVMMQEVFNKMTRFMASKDYEYAAAVLLAVKDALNFPQVPQDGERLIPRLDGEIKKFSNATFSLTEEQRLVSRRCQKTRLSSFAVWFTLGGALVPPRLRHRLTICSFQQSPASWMSQSVAYLGDSTGRSIQERMAIKIWNKALLSLLKILFSRRKKFLHFLLT